MIRLIKIFLKTNWPILLVISLFIKPRFFLREFFYPFLDYYSFKKSVKYLIKKINALGVTAKNQPNDVLLIVAGNGMGAQWLQIWSILATWLIKRKNVSVFALTTKKKPIQNLYFKFFKFDLIFLEDLKTKRLKLSDALLNKINGLNKFSDIKNFEYHNAPVGKMALSTFSRQKATGIMDVENEDSRSEIKIILIDIIKTIDTAHEFFQLRKITLLFFTEVFMEEYGSIYYAALNEGLNIVRFAGTVRDDSVVIQHLTPKSDRTHFSSISGPNWKKIERLKNVDFMFEKLRENFKDRYGEKWSLSKRNQPNTKLLTADKARKILKVPKNKKIAIIYSHILYDTLFFNGEDIFDNYADWLIQTVTQACKNPNVQWYVKIHPSNLWRGELEYYNNGVFEEVRLIEKYIGKLPEHVKFIFPDTSISPYTWLEIADFGITVRGTSGIELGALGKTVLTAGTGRYENIGFTINSKCIPEYLDLITTIQDIEKPSKKQTDLAIKFAYATFCMKPFELDFFLPAVCWGKKEIRDSNDLVFVGKKNNEILQSLHYFENWVEKKNEIDLLSNWPSH